MALEKYFPFRSVAGDRKYSAEDWAAYFAQFLSDGVFYNNANNLKVVANDAMKVTVNMGAGFVEGRMYILELKKVLTIDTADGVLNRIDRIVLRCDHINRLMGVDVIKGNYSSAPKAPELTRNADVYELALADVYVAAGAIEITDANITDQRLNTSLCGIVTGLVEQADTTEIFNQFQVYLEEFKEKSQADFEYWFNNLKAVLDADAEGNLLALIEREETERKKEIEVERERINQIVALEEGSTTGDIELMDIRVGVNGKKYDSAGEAVRSQIKDMSETIGYIKLDKNVIPEWEEAINGSYRNINSEGNITNIVTTGASASRLTLPLSVRKGTTVNVKSRNYDDKAVIAFSESEEAEKYTVLITGVGLSLQEYSATIEKDGFVVFQCHKAYIDEVEIYISGTYCDMAEETKKNTTDIEKVNEDMGKKAEKEDIETIVETVGYMILNEDITPTWEETVNGYYRYIDMNGKSVDIISTGASATRLTFPIEVKVGAIVTVKTQQYEDRASIAFIENETDKVYTVLALGGNGNLVQEYSAIVEKNGFIVVACHKNSVENVEIHIGGATSELAIKVDENRKRLADIEKSMNVIENTFYPDFYVVGTNRGSHDCTFIGDKLVSFNKPSDGYASVINASTLQREKEIQVNFTEPHSLKELEMKSCDYKFGKLLVGNGRAIKHGETSYLEQGAKLYVFYNAETWVDKTEQITLENCGLYDIIDISEIGYKVYGFWGQFEDCVFVSCNLFNDIYLIQLGKGSNNLGQGMYVENASNRYNGSYMVIKHWNQDGRLGECAAHGGQYYKGSLYLATNNSNLCTVYKCNLKHNGSLSFDALELNVMEAEELKYRYIDGLCIKDGVLYAQPLYGDDNKAIIVADI